MTDLSALAMSITHQGTACILSFASPALTPPYPLPPHLAHSCQADLTKVSGCCSQACWDALRSPEIAGDCLNSLVVGMCNMAAANITGAAGLLQVGTSVGTAQDACCAAGSRGS